MSTGPRSLEREFSSGLRDYLLRRDEAALQRAYRLARESLARGVGVLEIEAACHAALREILLEAGAGDDVLGILERSSSFFKETLAPFEMTHRSFKEANAELRELTAGLERQVSERTEALMKAEENYRLVYAEMSDGIALFEGVYDDDGRLEDCLLLEGNPTFETMTGLKLQDVRGVCLSRHVGLSDLGLLALFSGITASGQPAESERYYAGNDKFFKLSAFSHRAGQFAALFSDVTARIQAEELSRSLGKVEEAIHSTLEFDTIMQTVIQEAARALGADAAVIELREGPCWNVRYVHALPDGPLGAPLTDGGGIAELVGSRRSAVFVEAARGDPRFDTARIQRLGIRSFLAIPMMARQEVEGVLIFLYFTRAAAFTTAHVDFSSRLASTLALAMENARLFESQRRIADTLQESLLRMPERLEGIEFGYLYRSATESARAGGDFIDIFEREDDEIAIAAGDVSGKGIEAVHRAAFVKDALRAYANRLKTPSLVMTKTNEILCNLYSGESFVTIFFGILHVRTGRLSYCLAGHPPPLIKRAEGSVEILEVYSMVAGGRPGFRYRNAAAKVRRGDALIIYSDGIYEAWRGRRYPGKEWLAKMVERGGHLPASVMPRALFDAVGAVYGEKIIDDITILTIRLA